MSTVVPKRFKMDNFISEPITPAGGRFDAAAMGKGEPGLPSGFLWRDHSYGVVARLEQWKDTSAEGGRPGGQVYLRRHFYRIAMSDSSIWTVYFVRQSPRSGATTQRWFLYTIDKPEQNR